MVFYSFYFDSQLHLIRFVFFNDFISFLLSFYSSVCHSVALFLTLDLVCVCVCQLYDFLTRIVLFM